MAITVESITDTAVESLEWDFQQGYRSSHDTDVSDYIHQAIDSALVYTSDIVDYWRRAGMPEPEYSEIGDHDSISSAITAAVYDHLGIEATEYDVLRAWLEIHAGNDALADIDLDDVNEAYAALVEWKEEN